MRRLWHRKVWVVALLGLVLVAISLLAAPVTTAEETSGALVIFFVEDNGSCTVLDQSQNPIEVDSAHAVITYNDRDKAQYRCEASGIENHSGSAITYDYASTGFECIFKSSDPLWGGKTRNWRQTISASGQLSFTCNFN